MKFCGREYNVYKYMYGHDRDIINDARNADDIIISRVQRREVGGLEVRIVHFLRIGGGKGYAYEMAQYDRTFMSAIVVDKRIPLFEECGEQHRIETVFDRVAEYFNTDEY